MEEIVQEKDTKATGKEMQKELLKELQKILKPYNSILDLKAGDPEFQVSAVKAFKAWTDNHMLSHSLDNLKGSYLPLFEEELLENQRNYKQYEGIYLRSIKEKGAYIRETSQGWRTGHLSLETRPTLAQIRYSFNRIPLTEWKNVRSELDLFEQWKKAEELIMLVSIPEEQLIQFLWTSYKKAIVEKHDQVDGQRCLIKDAYREFDSKIKQDSEWKKKLGVMIKDQYPLWAFLYNLDRYRLLGSKIPSAKRLGLQTGSQQEVSQGLGMTVNGLVPEEDYKIMCYLVYSAN